MDGLNVGSLSDAGTPMAAYDRLSATQSVTQCDEVIRGGFDVVHARHAKMVCGSEPSDASIEMFGQGLGP